ncbi:MAG: hypothetical protein ABW034_05910 [Steroidobacteraceae bacterium]
MNKRLDFYDAGMDSARITAAETETVHIQNRLWTLASRTTGQDPHSIPAGLLIQSLNEVFDLAEKRQDALENRVPNTVLYLLFAVSFAAIAFIAYSSGLSSRRHAGSTGIFALLIAFVLITIIDLDRPREGLIRISQDSMRRIQTQLANFGPATRAD